MFFIHIIIGDFVTNVFKIRFFSWVKSLMGTYFSSPITVCSIIKLATQHEMLFFPILLMEHFYNSKNKSL